MTGVSIESAVRETSLLVTQSIQNSGLKLELPSSVRAVHQREHRSERKSPDPFLLPGDIDNADKAANA